MALDSGQWRPARAGTAGVGTGITPHPSDAVARARVALPASSTSGGAYLAMARGWNRLGALISPLRLTAETATTSGGVPLQVCEVFAPGMTCVAHVPPVRVCTSQSQALPCPLDAQERASEPAR